MSVFFIAGMCALALAAGLACVTAYRHKRLMMRLDAMLDDAAAGTVSQGVYDEAQVSKIEAKMAQFLSGSRLKKEHTEEEKKKIHALISDISHQTKTPVANIVLYAGLLAEQEELPQEAQAYAAQIAQSADKLRFLLQELMKSSRLEAGLIAVVLKREDICVLAARAVEMNREQAERKGIRLECSLPPQGFYASADARWCAEALHNLVDNAVKYTPVGGQVCVSVKAYAMFVCVQVQDTGKGIAPDDLPRVFGRFWRAADSGAEDGIGIGLFLAREIVSACGGYIKAESNGQGACFSMFLPREA